MKMSDLGFDTETGMHDKNLTRWENLFLGILWTDHQGADNKISADELAFRFRYALDGRDLPPGHHIVDIILVQNRTGHSWITKFKRNVRHAANHLLTKHDNIPILSKAGIGGGYWLAESEQEAEEFYHSFRQRGMTGLVKASRGKKAILVDIVKQLTFEFETLVDHTGSSGPVRPIAGTPAEVEVIDAFLEKMTANPEKYADDLRKISRKYGSVLLPKSQFAAMKTKTDELQKLVSQIGV